MIDHPELDESRAVRLARFLKEFSRLGATVVRDLSKYEQVLWFYDMPQDPDCASPAWSDAFLEEGACLVVKKQKTIAAPILPSSLGPWLDYGLIAKATEEIPPLSQTAFVTDGSIETGDEAPLPHHVSIEDYPSVRREYDEYMVDWQKWSNETRRSQAIQRVYSQLFSLYTQLQKQGELLEVVLGFGLIERKINKSDNPTSICRHSIVARVKLEFDQKAGVIRVVIPEGGANLQIEEDMLDADLQPEPAERSVLEQQLAEIGDEVWDKAQMHTAIRSWANSLSSSASWSPELRPALEDAKEISVSFAPALILRKRTQIGMIEVYEKLIQQLMEEPDKTPIGWEALVDDLDDSDATSERQPSLVDNASLEPSEEVFFPLLANQEQRRIVEALKHHQGVVVQGPPGTGKSHTIANLVCHLLASGKRVLVTAETGRALRVLKDKLPKEIQPLCVTLLDQNGDGQAELNKAVQGITTRQASFNAQDYDQQIAQLMSELDVARQRRAQIDTVLRSLREDEILEHSIANGVYVGTASAIGEQVSKEKAKYQWLSLPPNAPTIPSVNTNAALDWLRLQRKYDGKALLSASSIVPSIHCLPTIEVFADSVARENDLKQAVHRTADMQSTPEYEILKRLPSAERDSLVVQLKELERLRVQAMGRTFPTWQMEAVSDVESEARSEWDNLHAISCECLRKVNDCREKRGSSKVLLPTERDRRILERDVRIALNHLQKGGKWKVAWIFTPTALRDREYLKQALTVNGLPAETVESLELVLNELELQTSLDSIRSKWAEVAGQPMPSDERTTIAKLEELIQKLRSILAYAESHDRLAHIATTLNPPIALPSMTAGEIRKWIDISDAVSASERLRSCSEEIDSALRELNVFQESHPAVSTLRNAIKQRDVSAFARAYNELVQNEKVRSDLEERDRLRAVLNDVVPGLAETITKSLNDDKWEERLSLWDQAWAWCKAKQWLDLRDDSESQLSFILERKEVDGKIGRLIGQIAALHAWKRFFKRLSAAQLASLKSWLDAVQKMGKGKGRTSKLSRLRQDARREIEVCRDAVPVWIMPRHLVAEMIAPNPARFDVVIVDESSQLGIQSLFLFYLGKKMIVVGDDQQISPYGIGIEDDRIASLRRRFLNGIPHQNSFSLQSSLYDNAKIRFSQNIVLREHFRCMPEIIQFSNDLCYAPNGSALDPLRIYGANRLEPLMVRHVSDGYRTGNGQNVKNSPEADAIVQQIVDCVHDPRYNGLTMGVISLQGDEQAKLIESKLLLALEPEQIEARRLICGDAYAFQGDERHVIFLSMVAAMGEGRIGPLADESAKRRFNVAASRAQDQLWLFHSVTLDQLSEKCMRYRLLKYMLSPAREVMPESNMEFDSRFEREVYRMIVARGYRVNTQVCVGDPSSHHYRIDLVVEGIQGRLAIECDGDVWHSPERYDQDMARQRDLERAGWQFVRIRGGDFYRDPEKALIPVWSELDRLGITPASI